MRAATMYTLDADMILHQTGKVGRRDTGFLEVSGFPDSFLTDFTYESGHVSDGDQTGLGLGQDLQDPLPWV